MAALVPQHVSSSVREVFPFFASAQNLERLTPSFLQFNLQNIPAKPLRRGSTTGSDYTEYLCHGGLELKNGTPPLGFADVQVWGPFRRWHHRHEFAAFRSGTLIKDKPD